MPSIQPKSTVLSLYQFIHRIDASTRCLEIICESTSQTFTHPPKSPEAIILPEELNRTPQPATLCHHNSLAIPPSILLRLTPSAVKLQKDFLSKFHSNVYGTPSKHSIFSSKTSELLRETKPNFLPEEWNN